VKEGALAGAVTEEAEVRAGETESAGATSRAGSDPKERGASGALAVQDQEVEREGRVVAGIDVTTEPGAGVKGAAARVQSPKMIKQTK